MKKIFLHLLLSIGLTDTSYSKSALSKALDPNAT